VYATDPFNVVLPRTQCISPSMAASKDDFPLPTVPTTMHNFPFGTDSVILWSVGALSGDIPHAYVPCVIAMASVAGLSSGKVLDTPAATQ
jgi:hypothetical protein